MSPSPIIPADAMPLREALRGLRFLLRRGGETLADTMPVETLPRPASALATSVLREVGGIVRSVDSVASNVAKLVLGGPDSLSAPLDELVRRGDADVAFARAIYAALGAVLRRFGATNFFVSEMSARATFAAWQRDGGDGDMDLGAADLALRLLEARVIRGTTTDRAGAVPDGALDGATVFAVLLWLQSARSESENEAALDAAADIASAKAGEVDMAVQAGDRERIAALFRKYVGHV